MASGGGSGGSAKEHKPYIAADMSVPEMTIKAVILGIILSITMSAANAYAG